MALTTYFDIPMPVEGDDTADEFYRLQVAWGIVDGILKAILDNANGRAPIGHTHTMAGVVGLEEALAGKMPANAAFSLDDLTDVEGAILAPNGYVLVKTAGGWVPASPAAAIGAHGHSISEITGLDTVLASYYTKTAADAKFMTSAQAAAAHYTKTEVGSLIAANRVPIGSSIMWNSPTIPSGFLKENGALISRAAYPELFSVIGTRFSAGDGSTTFGLPDSRAEFIRGLDDGRGVDSGRALGSLQAGLVAAHVHGSGALNFAGNALPAHNHGVEYGTGSGSGQVGFTPDTGRPSVSSWVSAAGYMRASASSAGTPTGNVTGTTDSFGGAENRPRNVSKLFLIRAF